MKSKILLLLGVLFLSACGGKLEDPRIEFPVVSPYFTSSVEHVKPIVP